MVADYDLAIIGGGPGGYVAAIRATQLRLKTAIIERQWWGGVCLNVGCIPTKCLLEDTHLLTLAQEGRARGVIVEKLSFDFAAMQSRKDSVVKQLTSGVRTLLQKNGVDMIEGSAEFVDTTSVSVRENEESRKVKSENFIIATGSRPAELPYLSIDHRIVLDSTDVLSLSEVPASLAIIGAGAIGLELGSIFARLGSTVTIIEIMPQCLPGTDRMVASSLARELKKQGLTIHLDSRVTGFSGSPDGATLEVEGKFTGEVNAEKVLLSVGRVPNTGELGLEAAGVRVGEHGFVEVNEMLQTSVPSIYAVGDVIGGKLVAHKASYEGERAAEAIAGRRPTSTSLVPVVTYTSPEVASVGITAQEAQEQGRMVKEGLFAFAANGRSLAMAAPTGFVKVVGDAENDQLLGVHVIGPYAGELIAEAAMAMARDITVKEYSSVIRAHPTLAESLHEAALDAHGIPIHKIRR